jgi:hypothetical protein
MLGAALIYLAGCAAIACLVTLFEAIWDEPWQHPEAERQRSLKQSFGGSPVRPLPSQAASRAPHASSRARV